VTVSIGGIVLSDHLFLPGLKNLPSRAMSARTTLGGRPVVQSIPLAAGQILELVDPGDGTGLFTGTQIDSINVFRASGNIVSFVHHLGTWKVIVEEVEVEQDDGYNDPINADTYIGTITMRIME